MSEHAAPMPWMPSADSSKESALWIARPLSTLNWVKDAAAMEKPCGNPKRYLKYERDWR
jgi:hypothetical protein